MEALKQIFAKPFEVTQFWASERYAATGQSAGSTEGHLFRYCPEHVRQHQPPVGADWFFEVCNGDGGPFAGDFLPRFLPTRNNIVSLNRACVVASAHLGANLEKGPMKGDLQDDAQLFTGLEAYPGVGTMATSNDQYRKDLWQVLRDDWGLELPLPDQFGSDQVVINHRPGLPCAAAMVRAVLPIIVATRGELEVVEQSTSEEHGRMIDVMEYVTSAGERLTQRYDITDLFGRGDLDWEYFHF